MTRLKKCQRRVWILREEKIGWVGLKREKNLSLKSGLHAPTLLYNICWSDNVCSTLFVGRRFENLSNFRKFIKHSSNKKCQTNMGAKCRPHCRISKCCVTMLKRVSPALRSWRLSLNSNIIYFFVVSLYFFQIYTRNDQFEESWIKSQRKVSYLEGREKFNIGRKEKVGVEEMISLRKAELKAKEKFDILKEEKNLTLEERIKWG